MPVFLHFALVRHLLSFRRYFDILTDSSHFKQEGVRCGLWNDAMIGIKYAPNNLVCAMDVNNGFSLQWVFITISFQFHGVVSGPCASSPCQNAPMQCLNIQNGYRCICGFGYKGVNCEESVCNDFVVYFVCNKRSNFDISRPT